MWIQTSNENLVRIQSEYSLNERVEFSESGAAQVSREVGESMIEHYDSISEYNND